MWVKDIHNEDVNLAHAEMIVPYETLEGYSIIAHMDDGTNYVLMNLTLESSMLYHMEEINKKSLDYIAQVQKMEKSELLYMKAEGKLQ